MSGEMIELINKTPCCYLATCSRDGAPNVVPCGSTTAIDPETIVVAAVFLDKTLRNIKENPKVALTFHTPAPSKEEASPQALARVKGWQVKGAAQLLASGPVYERTKEMVKARLGEPATKMLKGALVVRADEIYSTTPGPEAGRRIA